MRGKRHKALMLKDGTIVYHRRLYRNGNNSIHIALPKDWCRDVGLKGGDEIVIVRKNDQLVILPMKNFDTLETFRR